MPVRFHLDENLTSRIATGLRNRDIDCTTTKDAGLLHAVDGEQLAHATDERRVIITRDSDFIALHHWVLEQKENHSGIIYCANRKKRFGILIKEITTMALELDEEEFRDKLFFL